MPIEQCNSNGTPGFKYGNKGKCYLYDPSSEKEKIEAFKNAMKQMKARFAKRR